MIDMSPCTILSGKNKVDISQSISRNEISQGEIQLNF
jgi:hypothetical protein